MISEQMSKLLAAGLFALLVFDPASAPAAASRPKVAVVAFGLFGDQSVFESEAKSAARITARRFGGSPVIVRANTKSRSNATVGTLATALGSAAKEINAENDILLLILTSHGSPTGLTVKTGYRQETLPPSRLAAVLNHAGVRHRIVIISACYSGIFVHPLADADTLVITAADADHRSFGLKYGAEWTYFGDAFFNTAMRRTTNLKNAFALARAIIRKRELRTGFGPSNPQMAGGENIERLLDSTASTTLPPISGRRSRLTQQVSAVSCSLTRRCGSVSHAGPSDCTDARG
jgi:Peptidase C13 family